MRFFEFLSEGIGWLKIVASPFLAGAVIGGIVYLSIPNALGIFLGIVIALLGLIIGIIWATRIWKNKGTMKFLSKMNSTPELDKIDVKSK